MATIRDITILCRSGRVMEAYDLAKADYDASPQDVWVQRELGWALYYILKEDVAKNNYQEILSHLELLSNLELLNSNSDPLIFDNLLWALAGYVKSLPKDRTDQITELFSIINKYTFSPSKGYSFLLKSFLSFDGWSQLADFFEWWDIDKLLPEDYQQFKMENGKKIMSLAEQAYIAYSKVLLGIGNKDRISAFLPKIEKLNDDYPDMMYPGYFCGKLMLAMGTEKEAALTIVRPFVRKKRNEFWVWQLLSEMYNEDEDMKLACLLRAVHCRTQETFLGKVRAKLVSLFITRHDYPRAKYHLDQIVRCYIQQGWHLSFEVQNWIREHWVQETTADNTDAIDYISLTDTILTYGAKESLAVVTYVDTEKKRARLVYGEKQMVTCKFSDIHLKIRQGSLLKLKWVISRTNEMNIVGASPADTKSLQEISYIKRFDGQIEKRDDKPFAFIKGKGIRCFISPNEVQRYSITGGEEMSVLAVYSFNKKKNEWSWACVTLNKIKQK